MAQFKYHNFDNYIRSENQSGLEGKIATHHMKLFHLVASRQAPIVVELGVDKGQSTCILLTACEKQKGHLYSVDIRDCSDVAVSKHWTFIQANDLDIETILQAAPILMQGIDLLHIDSIHTAEHVTELLMKWFPYVKPEGYITFHDIDETPYKPGRRKQNRIHAKEFIGLATAVKNFFYANEEQLFLEFHFGSTGMGIMKKLSPLGKAPQVPATIKSWPSGVREAFIQFLRAIRFSTSRMREKLKQ